MNRQKTMIFLVIGLRSKDLSEKLQLREDLGFEKAIEVSETSNGGKCWRIRLM